jgi:hypothetical protein
LRILAQVQAGFSYAAIGREEGITRERVRQIVVQALDEGGSETKLDHARVQIARLEPALRLAARGVADGDLSAIDRLLRVLDRLDRYSAVEGAGAAAHAGARERLLTKLNTMAERMIRARQAGIVDAAGRYRQPGGDAGLDAQDNIDSTSESAASSSASIDEA